MREYTGMWHHVENAMKMKLNTLAQCSRGRKIPSHFIGTAIAAHTRARQCSQHHGNFARKNKLLKRTQCMIAGRIYNEASGHRQSPGSSDSCKSSDDYGYNVEKMEKVSRQEYQTSL